jgi:cellulose synthase/poly-beta-1,6-N-acetylglucosamine synthase-like glycosyltransferase
LFDVTQTVPQISLVIPVYNGAATLESCLNSVRQAVDALSAQRRKQVEVVVCDNHSDDESLRIARAARYACRARVIQPPAHLPNRTDNWHYALSAGEGDWLLMLHADDALVDGGLGVWLDAIASPLSAEVGFITARHHTFTDGLDNLSSPLPRVAPAPALLRGRALVRWVLPLICPFMPFVLVRRAAYEEVGGLDRRFELTQDWDLWIRLCRRYDVLYVPGVVGAWRSHPTSAKYQRLNMTEQIQVLEQIEAQRSMRLPPPIHWMARRSLRARVTTILRSDDADEAQQIRIRAGALGGRAAQDSGSWLRASGVLVSGLLNGLRATGAVRAALASRSRRPTNAHPNERQGALL